MIGTRWRNPPPQKTCCLADAMDLDRDEMAAALVAVGSVRLGRVAPAKPKRPSEEILHDMERLAYDTRHASQDRTTGEYRSIDEAVLAFTAETMRRLVAELVGK